VKRGAIEGMCDPAKKLIAATNDVNESAKDKICNLSNQAIACDDPEELKKISSDLREALHDHLQSLKQRLAERASKAKASG
jgi:hypothetical protein